MSARAETCRGFRSVIYAVASACLIVLSADSDAHATDVRPPDPLLEIRKLDRIELADGRTTEGEIITPGDPLAAPEIEIMTGRTVRIAIPQKDVKSVTPRRSAEDVYKDWRRWLAANARERSLRARAELELAKWCILPHVELDGSPPRPAEDALHHFENAVRLDSKLEEAYPWLVLLYSEARPIDSTSLDLLDREAETWRLAKDAGLATPAMNLRLGEILARRAQSPLVAAPFFEAVLEAPEAREGDDLRARDLLAEIRFAAGDREGAYALWREVLDERSGGETGEGEARAAIFEAAWKLARLRMRAGGATDRAIARDLLERAIQEMPEIEDVLIDLARVDAADGRLSEADASLARFLEAHPDGSEARLDRALVLIRLGKLEDATRELDQAESTSPSEGLLARLQRLRGIVASRSGKIAEAVAAFEKALALAPDSALDRLLLAEAKIDLGDVAASRRELEEIQRQFPSDRETFAAASRLLARGKASEGATKDAARLFEYATEVWPEDAALLEAAGLAFASAGEEVRASTLLASAYRLAPERAGVLAGLAWLRYGEGAMEEARRYLAGADRDEKAAVRDWVDHALVAVNDLERLEVWRDDFSGVDGPVVDGWEEQELWGIEATLRSEEVVFEGVQRNDPDGETVLSLMRPVSALDFERVSVRVKLGAGRGIPSLRLETPRDGRQRVAGIEVFVDLDGRVKPRVRSARDGWEEPEVSQPDPEKQRSRKKPELSYGGGVPWPGAGEYHRLEIERLEEGRGRTRSGQTFVVRVDGVEVARHLEADGLAGSEWRAMLVVRAGGEGSACLVHFDDFELYREARRGATAGDRD